MPCCVISKQWSNTTGVFSFLGQCFSFIFCLFPLGFFNNLNFPHRDFLIATSFLRSPVVISIPVPPPSPVTLWKMNALNPLSTNPMVKHTQTICRILLTNCLSGFDQFVGLAVKGLENNLDIDPFQGDASFQYPVQTAENLRFSDILLVLSDSFGNRISLKLRVCVIFNFYKLKF